MVAPTTFYDYSTWQDYLVFFMFFLSAKSYTPNASPQSPEFLSGVSFFEFVIKNLESQLNFGNTRGPSACLRIDIVMNRGKSNFNITKAPSYLRAKCFSIRLTNLCLSYGTPPGVLDYLIAHPPIQLTRQIKPITIPTIVGVN